MAFPTDIEIANSANIQHIKKIAEKLNIPEDDLEMYGKYKAKLPLTLIDPEKIKQNKLILVTAITPTPAGEGKTTTSIGLVDGLNKVGKQALAVLREPSLGPVFGVKGGAAGGGYAQVIPMEDINLHFTGDFAAIEKANNLLSAALDNNLNSKKRSLNIDPKTITWKRVMDMNDRTLRQIIIGVGDNNGVVRQDGFNITPASEIMAILCLSENFSDLKERLGNIYVADTFNGKPVFARDLKVVGAMAILLKDAIKPNLVQTLEGNPAIIHGGPFASIAQGTNTAIATKMGLSLSNYVVTEAGFGADLGAEKFLDIKCTSAGLSPDAAVVVATVRALRHHGGASKDELQNPDLEKLKLGFPNLEKHIENVQKFNLKPVVAINLFPNDSEEELQYIIDKCAEKGVKAVVAEGFAKGGDGMKDLAKAVVEIAENNTEKFTPIYNANDSVEDKINKIATEIYGAKSVKYLAKAKRQIKELQKNGFDKLPVCMVKTPKSLSDDDKKLGRPEGFFVTVREFEIAAGAGFIIPMLGDAMRMPGLPPVPAAEGMDIDDQGVITGLS
ncbi:formate--tetrahydrofolate ligase [Ornithobacterium rhinotracheale]|uniref:Formate--tetrahydrofolate ligase n=1 Tax=Ornithobacterium rhinotracheale (strain ATCC 51463 / DSM 15997 / CCUG 23171 / CIP 104009 / LMG 9086) TaxID=867902 RepID=I3ZXJ4_ORNRL|nr:formate--tetrahydrofolate ligase [Ornithobacterium rhinotracheale]AFL96428.1 formyltetrahydrofolate synthetase [Ornithobacterium rhinotracheale DSM 15997]AIP98641.1 formate--tetrahydrofolate ligase [Ornithobacterium rhinotracheale ORT-UMN 88]KGB67639.1 formate--tetrahydrofolate ligase [Ornithobacterium rhinotracheale H06-030791]MCK0194756.1 formate--tetrahydrofolate ligase [Ornithobacterium rhinotracheale]MCK0200777.1 formate--tetrahydrofolate ligase [Ornithobacterium rhinotracheale]